MTKLRLSATMVFLLAVWIVPNVSAFRAPDRPPLANFDQRREKNVSAPAISTEQSAAAAQLRARVSKAKVDFDDVTRAPKLVQASDGFLSGPDARGKAISSATTAAFAGDPHRATKAFLQEHRKLFGHGPEALDQARVQRDFVTPHNGMRTVVWEQQVAGLPVFDALLISHTTRQGELVNLSSQFLPDDSVASMGGATLLSPQASSQGKTNLAAPTLLAREAVARAARNLGEDLAVENVTPESAGETPTARSSTRQKFRAPALRGEAFAQLVWLPMNKATLRLCWDVILTSRQRQEMFRVLVDAHTGDVLVRRCLTEHISNASYRVFTSDSPTPFSPAWPTPQSGQPPLMARELVTLPALDTNASPAGWINDGGNETLGNNVDAHLDRNGDDMPDLPRPQGSPFRVFDFAMDLSTQDPTAYGNAAVVQLFYLCNWMHDQLYELGFTEAAGNFQTDNFGRGGQGGDAVQADAQDGSGTDNADMTTPPDGQAPRMQMYIFSGSSPRRDGDLDAEIVLHEYTHGLSNRRVGGGVGISALQTEGMGEGWSDFYALSLLSQPGDDVNGVYAAAAYASYLLNYSLTQNYYYGIRRYPYTTDLTKNPLTFKDIDPAQASSHSGVPRSPVMGGGAANEVHNMGEVWCVTLWEARAAMINKYGHAAGNRLVLQLVTDGMNLSPGNPNFVQARDAILQADRVDNHGVNLPELWAAFAKRGLGFSATSPSSGSTTGLIEAYDLPDDLDITPTDTIVINGPMGGPFNPVAFTFTLSNDGSDALSWAVASSANWLDVTPGGGVLMPSGPTTVVTALPNAIGASLPTGIYTAALWFTNLTSGRSFSRSVRLRIGQPDFFAQIFDSTTNDLAFQTFTFTPNATVSQYSVCREPTTSFLTDPTGGNVVALTDDSYTSVILTGSATVALYGTRYNVFYIGSNGYLTFGTPDNGNVQSFANFFSLPRVAPLLDDLDPSAGGSISWLQLSNRVAVTYQNVPEYAVVGRPNSFQVELFFDGRIRLTFLALGARTGVVGLSAGLGIPAGFESSDFSQYAPCLPTLRLSTPVNATEGDGTLVGAGRVSLPAALGTDLVVALASSNTNEATVPATVTILAGSTNAAFDLTIVDDSVLDGTQTATITASAPGFHDGSTVLSVFDNETAVLHLVLPTSVIEGVGTVQGTVRLSAPPAADVTVGLSSGNIFRIQVPTSVVILAGATSTVFAITAPDNGQIDGAQTVTLTAHVANWTDGVASLTVFDNESLALAVTLPAQAPEDAGVLTNAGLVRIAGTLPTNLLVSLTSGNPAKVAVPPSAVIPAGQLTASFNLAIVDNALLDGDQAVPITASAPGFVSGTASIQVIDDEVPPVPSNPSPAHQSVNVPANTALSWSGAASAVTNAVFFGTEPAPSLADFVGLAPGTNWTLPLLAPNTTYYWQIVSLRLGVAVGPVWQFTTRGVDHFDWRPVASPQFANLPFNVTLTARDELGRAIPNFSGTVNLSAFTDPGPSSLFSDDFEDDDISDWTPGNGDYTRAVTTDTAAGGTHSLTLIGGDGSPRDGVSRTLPGLMPARIIFYVRTIDEYTVGGYFVAGTGFSTSQHAVFFYMEGNGTMGLYEGSGGFHAVPCVANQWYKITLECNWPLHQVDFYVDDVLAYAAVPFRGNVDNLTVLYLYNFDYTQAWWDEIQFLEDLPASALGLTPASAGPFVNGVWSGEVAVQNPALAAYLQADDTQAHRGTSAPFEVRIMAPTLPLPELTPGQCTLRFPTLPGRTYIIQYKNDLNSPNWFKLGAVTGDGTVQTLTDLPGPDTGQRFYRIKLQ